MKTIRIMGGLGNQLFQYAYGRNLELTGEEVVFDTSFYNGSKAKTDTARNFKLSNYNIKTTAEFSNKNHPLLNIYGKIKRRIGLKNEEFFQNEKYFTDYKDSILKEFTLKNPLSVVSQTWLEKINSAENPISLHIRRGDYISDNKTNSFHGVCDLKYYKKALEEITKKLGPSINIFVFSDDISWAKENLKFPFPTNFVSDPEIPDYEEMYLMSLCKHNIIANSTFSWWGAWLNQNPNKMVVAPKQWTVKKTSDELDILPTGWIRV